MKAEPHPLPVQPPKGASPPSARTRFRRLSFRPITGFSFDAATYSLRKDRYSSRVGRFRSAPIPERESRLKWKTSALPCSDRARGKNLLHVLFGEGEHDHRVNPEVSEHFQEREGPPEMTRASHAVVVCLEPLQAYLEEIGFPISRSSSRTARSVGFPKIATAKPRSTAAL